MANKQLIEEATKLIDTDYGEGGEIDKYTICLMRMRDALEQSDVDASCTAIELWNVYRRLNERNGHKIDIIHRVA